MHAQQVTLKIYRGLRHLALAGLFTLVLFGSEARAQSQISDQFKHVAKELAKRFVASELAQSCDKSDQQRDPICEALVTSLAGVFMMAVDGHFDEKQLALELRDEFPKIAQATAVELVCSEVERLFSDGPPKAGNCSSSGLGKPLARCLIARTYKGAAGSADDCVGARNALAAALNNCRLSDDITKLDVVQLMYKLRDALKVKGDSYQAVLLLTQLADLVNHSSGSFYGIVQATATAQDRLLRGLSTPSRMDVFSDKRIDEIANNASNCPGGALTAQRAEEWRKERWNISWQISRTIARFEPLRTGLNRLPDDLPDPRCASAEDPLAKAVEKLRVEAHTLRVDAMVASTVQNALIPAMLAAILVDYLKTQDDAKLQQNLRDFALQVLARVIAANDADNDLVACNSNDSTSRGLNCTRAGGSSFTVHVAEVSGEGLDDLRVVMEERHYAGSARRTCVYQAAASLLAGSFPTIQAAPNLCTMNVPYLKGTLFEAYLSPVAPGLMEWNAKEVVRSVTPGRATLRFTTGIGAQGGFQMLHDLLPRLVSKLNSIDLSALQGVLASLDAGLVAQAQRELLQGASDAFRPMLTAFLDMHVARLSWCQEPSHGKSMACAVRVLSDAAYDPLMASVSAPGGWQVDSHRLAQQLYTQLDTLDPLGTTPLLFNIGPGMTVLTRLGSTPATTHLTLLDKFGLAYRWGSRNQFEAGLFAGGFVDALVRTAVDGSGADPYWLLGGTIGLRQFSRTFPFGAEAHVASAMPFDTAHFNKKVAGAAGLNIIVPADIAFGSE
jgi:hypothetical protein